MDTTNRLIELVKQKETIPDSGVAYSNNVIVDLMDLALRGFIAPEMEKINEEHFVVTQDYQMAQQPAAPVGSPPVDVDNVITIPKESMGMRLRDIHIIGSDGTPYAIQRLTLTQAASMSAGGVWGVNGLAFSGNNQRVGGFYVQGNQIQLFPYGIASGKLVRLLFQQAPNKLVLESAAGRVVNVLGDVVQISTSQPQWTAGTRVCVVDQYNPHSFVRDLTVPNVVYTSFPVLSDVTLTTVSGNLLTFPTGKAAGISVGDWVCLEGESVFANNIPREMLPALVQKTAESILEAAGDKQGQQSANITYEKMIALAISALSPRVQGRPVKVLPLNSPFRAARNTSYGRY
jgi:hypothetical protein